MKNYLVKKQNVNKTVKSLPISNKLFLEINMKYQEMVNLITLKVVFFSYVQM